MTYLPSGRVATATLTLLVAVVPARGADSAGQQLALLVGVFYGTPRKLASYGAEGASSGMTHPAPAVQRAALVFVHGSWEDRIAARLAALGMRVDSIRLAVANNSSCELELHVQDNEIVKVEIPQRKGDPVVFDTDEHPRMTTLEALAKMKPAFKKDGSVTAGNASGINDAAAAIAMAAEGARVVVADLNEAGAKDVAERIGRAGGQALALARLLLSRPDMLLLDLTLSDASGSTRASGRYLFGGGSDLAPLLGLELRGLHAHLLEHGEVPLAREAPVGLERGDGLDPRHDLFRDVTRHGGQGIRTQRVLDHVVLLFRGQGIVHNGS